MIDGSHIINKKQKVAIITLIKMIYAGLLSNPDRNFFTLHLKICQLLLKHTLVNISLIDFDV